jgi:hypothetical protein
MISVKDLREWLESIDDDAMIGIDDAVLRVADNPQIYFELGRLKGQDHGTKV